MEKKPHKYPNAGNDREVEESKTYIPTTQRQSLLLLAYFLAVIFGQLLAVAVMNMQCYILLFPLNSVYTITTFTNIILKGCIINHYGNVL